MRIIPLTGKNGLNQEAFVDNVDLAWLDRYDWWSDGRGYCYTKINGKNTHMHRLILGVTDKKIQVDHIDGNKLNNQRHNLRTCTASQNRCNKGALSTNKSGYKGVVFTKESKINPWVAYIKYGKTRRNLGCFPTKELAAEAYNEAAKILHGDFAFLNKIKLNRT